MVYKIQIQNLDPIIPKILLYVLPLLDHKYYVFFTRGVQIEHSNKQYIRIMP